MTEPFVVGGLLFNAPVETGRFMSECGIDIPNVPMVTVAMMDQGQITAGAYFTAWHPGRDITITVACRKPGLSALKKFRRFYAWAFEHFGVPRITAEIERHNTRSIKLAEGIGFIKEGEKRGIGILMFGLLKEDMRI